VIILPLFLCWNIHKPVIRTLHKCLCVRSVQLNREHVRRNNSIRCQLTGHLHIRLVEEGPAHLVGTAPETTVVLTLANDLEVDIFSILNASNAVEAGSQTIIRIVLKRIITIQLQLLLVNREHWLQLEL